jgi:hypothetical protein
LYSSLSVAMAFRESITPNDAVARFFISIDVLPC